jgi:large subunit ribosomal protein L15
MNLSNLRPPKGQTHKKRRLGQGMGTGRGKFAGRGAKGAKSISGYSKMRGFDYAIINVGVLEKLEGDTFTPESLLKSGIVKKLNAGLKVLGNGELTRKIVVSAHVYSKAALDKIQQQGGSAEVIARPARVSNRPASNKKGAEKQL